MRIPIGIYRLNKLIWASFCGLAIQSWCYSMIIAIISKVKISNIYIYFLIIKRCKYAYFNTICERASNSKLKWKQPPSFRFLCLLSQLVDSSPSPSDLSNFWHPLKPPGTPWPADWGLLSRDFSIRVICFAKFLLSNTVPHLTLQYSTSLQTLDLLDS